MMQFFHPWLIFQLEAVDFLFQIVDIQQQQLARMQDLI